MNGDIGKVYAAINEVKLDVKEIKVRQEERNAENIKHMDKLDKAIDAMHTKPCIHHQGHASDIKRLYMWMWGLIVIIVGVAVKAIAG